ncbi:MAG: phage holin family protein [Sulfitobacter sp.]
MSHPDPREAPSLFVEAFRDFSNLMQTELHLAKAEISSKVSRAGTGIVFFVIAALLALTALNVLAGALVAYIASVGFTAGTAALIVGGVILLVAILLVLAGKSRLSASALEPSRTINNLQRDVSTVKGATNV